MKSHFLKYALAGMLLVTGLSGCTADRMPVEKHPINQTSQVTRAHKHELEAGYEGLSMGESAGGGGQMVFPLTGGPIYDD